MNARSGRIEHHASDISIHAATLVYRGLRAKLPRVWLCLLIIGLSALTGCATPPGALPDEGYISRAVVHADDRVIATVSVLADTEIEEEFGARLDLVGIQPVWLRIKNLQPHGYVLFLKSIDPDYFSPYEVARRSSIVSPLPPEALYTAIRDKEIDRYIPPGADVSGFVYTHGDEGLRPSTSILSATRGIIPSTLSSAFRG